MQTGRRDDERLPLLYFSGPISTKIPLLKEREGGGDAYVRTCRGGGCERKIGSEFSAEFRSHLAIVIILG